ncbi:hypothetical protein L2K70_17595 [Nocardioides KLBMP 9356]|uniref:Type IV toxin-antitoxin system AbiEi family antitoxin domain-containing protein n=1 Tax=Nocardioides potassii TaxID=2911371 RepID=A0ABS9HH36_9ACTN|nr:hypothetical protein [Nocardioides potassii]MCF6379428.1 hypothetical protein [Nocardioides potassii]
MHVTPTWAKDVMVLGSDAPLPVDRPFTAKESDSLGVGASLRRRLVQKGLLRPVLRGVFVASHLDDSLRLRVAATKLLVPEHAVAVDRTAAWVHGVDALPRSAIHTMPNLDIFSGAASRLRRPGVTSGIRDFSSADLTEIDGLRLTTQLRTTCDLGRLLWRFDALGAIDGFLRQGLDHGLLLDEVERFKGYRGVIQLRALAPIGDPKAESPPESALRLHWYDADIGTPQTQVWVHDDNGRPKYRIDVGEPGVRYGAEYFGELFHDEDVRQHDERRIAWLEQQRAWSMDIFTKLDVYGTELSAADRLRRGFLRAEAVRGARHRSYIDLSR